MSPPAKAAKATKKTAKKSTMSPAHKDAMAVGRTQGTAVRRYVDALEATRPKRGRKRTIETVRRQLTEVKKALPDSNGLNRVHLIQQQMDLEAELRSKTRSVDMAALQKGFVASAAEYGSRKGLSYAAWRAAGVPADVLKAAGITRST